MEVVHRIQATVDVRNLSLMYLAIVTGVATRLPSGSRHVAVDVIRGSTVLHSHQSSIFSAEVAAASCCTHDFPLASMSIRRVGEYVLMRISTGFELAIAAPITRSNDAEVLPTPGEVFILLVRAVVEHPLPEIMIYRGLQPICIVVNNPCTLHTGWHMRVPAAQTFTASLRIVANTLA